MIFLHLVKVFHSNLAKRIVKHPRIYLRDSGLLHPLLLIALKDLELPKIWVVHPGKMRFPMHKNTEAIPLAAVVEGEMKI